MRISILNPRNVVYKLTIDEREIRLLRYIFSAWLCNPVESVARTQGATDGDLVELDRLRDAINTKLLDFNIRPS